MNNNHDVECSPCEGIGKIETCDDAYGTPVWRTCRDCDGLGRVSAHSLHNDDLENTSAALAPHDGGEGFQQPFTAPPSSERFDKHSLLSGKKEALGDTSEMPEVSPTPERQLGLHIAGFALNLLENLEESVKITEVSRDRGTFMLQISERVRLVFPSGEELICQIYRPKGVVK